ncbi:DnaB-like helicase C-terminal domain-containing protein [Kitasatospora mediocidica]|uniref:DnaB-like helicase C-terminal domain-containing protein n=1 Tax=Kitasatospora mediocidica TaxID=58352 RepID=UPI0022B2D47A|nr:DnaB-like helicase C-terminal domain-containing protein [Kitasatospora mediocidica]
MPTVFRGLEEAGVHIRQGQFTLISAAPGIGKSAVSQTIATRARVPTYYFSADSDRFEMYTRAAAMLTGWRTEDIGNAVLHGKTETIDAKLSESAFIRYDFKSSPTPDDIEDELKAYAMTYGMWPRLVVMDNISNLDMGGGATDTAALEEASNFLHDLARETSAAVIALHHVQGPFNDGNVPVPLSGLRGQIGRVPERVLTLHNASDQFDIDAGRQILGLNAVKNRGGQSDPSAKNTIRLEFIPDRMLIRG